jgi:hypothetical protein
VPKSTRTFHSFGFAMVIADIESDAAEPEICNQASFCISIKAAIQEKAHVRCLPFHN